MTPWSLTRYTILMVYCLVFSVLAAVTTRAQTGYPPVDLANLKCSDIRIVDDRVARGPLLGAYLLQEYVDRGRKRLKRYVYSPSGEPLFLLGSSTISGHLRLLDVAGNVVHLKPSQVTSLVDIFSYEIDCRSVQVAIIVDDGNGIPLQRSTPERTSANSLLFRQPSNGGLSHLIYDRQTRTLQPIDEGDLAVVPSESDFPGPQTSGRPHYWMVWLPLMDERYFIPAADLCETQFICKKESEEWLQRIISKWIFEKPSQLVQSARREFALADAHQLCLIEKSIAFSTSFGASAEFKLISFEATASAEYKIEYEKGVVLIAKQKAITRDSKGYPNYSDAFTIRKHLSCLEDRVKVLDWVDLVSADGSSNVNIDFAAYGDQGKPDYFTSEVYLARSYPENFVEQRFKVVARTFNGMANFGPIMIDIARNSKFSFEEEPIDWYVMNKVFLAEIAGPEKK